jgi:hypothetical protein
LVVDFVAEHDQAVLFREVDHRLQGFAWIDGAGRVVGRDDDQGAGARGDQLAKGIKIGQPA